MQALQLPVRLLHGQKIPPFAPWGVVVLLLPHQSLGASSSRPSAWRCPAPPRLLCSWKLERIWEVEAQPRHRLLRLRS